MADADEKVPVGAESPIEQRAPGTTKNEDDIFEDAPSNAPAKTEDAVKDEKNSANDANDTDTKPQVPENQSPEALKPVYSVFSPGMKRFLVVMTVFGTFFSPFSSSIYFPAITPIANEYGRPVSDINLSVTTYQIMQALAPLFFGDLSDQIGRRPVYLLSFAIYLGANIGLAVQHSYPALMVLRAMQSTGSSATVAIGNAVMADFATSADRGGFIAAVQASVMFAPALATTLGGILSQFLGWRSTFWCLVIMTGVFLAVYLPAVPETARNIVGNGSIPPPKSHNSLYTHFRQRKLRRQLANDPEVLAEALPPPKKLPLKIPIPNIWAAVVIIFEKDVGPLMLFMSLFVMANYAVMVPIQDVIRRQYNFNDLQVGLCFIPFSVGSVVGSIMMGKALNWNYARVAKSIGVSPDRKRGDDLRNFPIERARLDLLWPSTFLAIGMIIGWGWVVTAGTSLAAPLVVLFFAGLALAGPVSVLTTLLVDLYPMNPGRVSSTFNLSRATFSAVGTAVVQYMIEAWGYGYTYLFMGLLVLAASPSVLVVRKWGPKWREERYQRFAKKQQKSESK
ncbi:major facilitator superfamily domain-containing protein [Chaetomium sp. MPI-SDFR-AT-0129]|nr:major facilitator superfamily domain-containing protein [Chaetomium sp. MPI-SDFR-AT-0129]